MRSSTILPGYLQNTHYSLLTIFIHNLVIVNSCLFLLFFGLAFPLRRFLILLVCDA